MIIAKSLSVEMLTFKSKGVGGETSSSQCYEFEKKPSKAIITPPSSHFSLLVTVLTSSSERQHVGVQIDESNPIEDDHLHSYKFVADENLLKVPLSTPSPP
jgi:hypothetical protein